MTQLSQRSVVYAVLLFTAFLAMGGQHSSAGDSTAVYVDPPTAYPAIGQTFVVDVMVDVAYLAAFDFQVFWDTSILDCVSATPHPPWQYYIPAGNQVEEIYNSTHGRYRCAYAWRYPASSFSGTASLATLTFEADLPGECTLDLTHVILVNEWGNPVDGWNNVDSLDDGYVMASQAGGQPWTGGTIFIRADGSVDPPAAPIHRDGSTYTLTGYINSDADGVVVERSNLVIDGAGYVLRGAGSDNGFYWSNRSNVTLEHVTISNFTCGVNLPSSSDSSVLGSRIADSYYGVRLSSSSNNIVSGNNATDNYYGIYISYSSNTSISGNNVASNSYGVYSYGSSNHNSISANHIANNGLGIYLYNSSNNSISENTVTTNEFEGVSVTYSSNNNISTNYITAHSEFGLYLYHSSNSSISKNTIVHNDYGLYTSYASGNTVVHNNLINNTHQAYAESSVSIWDHGYPSGGNFWSTYNGTDQFRGQNQDIAGSDGIGDTPYVIGPGNTDGYPLMGLTGPSTQTGANVTVFPAEDVCLMLESVTEEGLTTVEETTIGPAPPPGVIIPEYYVIETTAGYSGQITIRIVLDGSMGTLANTTQENPRLLQCIMLAGDVDQDLDVDIFDLVRMAGVYGAVKPDPRYDPKCDLDGDGSIGIFDLVRMTWSYGDVWQAETGWVDITTLFDPDTNSIFGVTRHLSIFGVTR